MRDIKLRSHLSKINTYHMMFSFLEVRASGKVLVCSVQIISRVDSKVSKVLHYFRPPYWCPTDVHQHGVSIYRALYISGKHFDEYLQFGKTHRPKTLSSQFLDFAH